MVVQACNPAGEVQGHPQLHKLKVRLGYIRPCLFTNLFAAYLQINSKIKYVQNESGSYSGTIVAF